MLPVRRAAKERWRHALLLAALCLPCLCAAAPTRQRPAGEPLRLVWEKRLGAGKLWYEYKAMAATKDGEILIAASARNAPDAADTSLNRLLLWRVGRGGDSPGEIEIRKPQAADAPASKGSAISSTIRDVAALDNGDALLVVEFESARPSLVRVNRVGKQTMTRDLTGPDREVRLLKIVPASQGRFLLLGHESLNAIALEVDSSGAILWERKTDLGKMEFFVDGVENEDGSFTLVGNSGDYNAMRGGPSIVWVGQYDASGVLKSNVTFAGRYGRIARAPGGGYALVYDKGAAEAQDIRLKSLTPDLKESWEASITTATLGFTDFRVTALRGGGFVVAGGREGKPYVAKVDAQGKGLAALQTEAANVSVDVGGYGLVGDGDEVLVASSSIDIRDKANVLQKVRVMKISL